MTSIRRLQAVSGFRIWRNFQWPEAGLPEFDRYNLIYGWNGTGKTSLSRLFHCLETRTPLPTGVAELVVDGVAVSTNRLSTAKLPQVRVFNKDTIDRSVVAEQAPTVPLIYILGEESATKQAALDDLNRTLEEARATHAVFELAVRQREKLFEDLCTSRGREIRTLLTTPKSGEYNNYDARSFKASVAKHAQGDLVPRRLSEDSRERARLTHATPPKDRLRELDGVYPSIPTLTNKVHKILSFKVQVAAMLTDLDDPDIAAWVRDGIALHTGEHESQLCRFCTHDISPGRLKELVAQFNEEEGAHQAEIDSCLEEIGNAKEDLEGIQLPASGLLYPHLAADWEKAAASYRAVANSTKSYLRQLEGALLAKKKSPFQSIGLPPAQPMPSEDGPPSGLDVALSIGAVLLNSLVGLSGQASLQQLNALIAAHNKYTANYAAEGVAARRTLEEGIIAGALEEYREREALVLSGRADLATSVETIKGRESRAAQLQEEIRDARKSAERLTRDLANYLGRDEFTFNFAGNGYQVNRHGEPATNLSEGERTAVAFVYFLQSLEDDGFDLVNGLVVIDDPVSSLDSNALYNAFAFMKQRIPEKSVFQGQLFVLTHSFAFFRAVKNWFVHLDGGPNKVGNLPVPKPSQRARFYSLSQELQQDNRAARLSKMDDLLYRFESEYHYLFSLVAGASRSGNGNLSDWYNLPNVGRRLLEAVLSFKAPGRVGELYQQLQLVEGFADVRKTRIVRFCNAHSHGTYMGEPDADISMLSETPEVMKDILDLIKHMDSAHYDSMMELLSAARE